MATRSMRFFDLAQQLSETYPEGGLLVGADPDSPFGQKCVLVLVLSRSTGKAIAVAVAESEVSLENGAASRWYWLSLLGLPLDVFVPEAMLEHARALCQRSRVKIRRLMPYVAGEICPETLGTF